MCEGYVIWDGLELDATRQGFKKNAPFEQSIYNYAEAKGFEVDRIDESPPVADKEFKNLRQIVSEVFSAIQQVDRNLAIDLFGAPADTQVIGQTDGKNKKGDEYKDKPNVDILNDAIESAMPIIFTGTNGPVCRINNDDTNGTDEGGNTRRVIEGGPYSIKTKEQGDEEKEKYVMPDIKIGDGDYGDEETLRLEYLEEYNQLLMLLNRRRPAFRILTKMKGIVVQRDIFADKIIRAAYRLKYKGNNVEEFERLVDQTWNTMYRMVKEVKA